MTSLTGGCERGMNVAKVVVSREMCVAPDVSNPGNGLVLVRSILTSFYYYY